MTTKSTTQSKNKRLSSFELFEELKFISFTTLNNSWFNHADRSSMLSSLDNLIDTARNLKIQLQREK